MSTIYHWPNHVYYFTATVSTIIGLTVCTILQEHCQLSTIVVTICTILQEQCELSVIVLTVCTIFQEQCELSTIVLNRVYYFPGTV